MKILVRFFAVTLFSCLFFMTKAQKVIDLYNQIVPNSKPCNKEEIINNTPGHITVQNIITPTLTVFIPEKQDSFKTAVIICPGGGYSRLAIGHEGYDVAKVLNAAGITAFVLKNRVPLDSDCQLNKETAVFEDAQQALKLVRQRAEEFNINPDKTGIMGFSAGGHLASTIGTHFNTNYIDNKEQVNLRPDFMILAYPVISFMDSLAHLGSKYNLLGKNASEEKVILYSNELQITPQTPPTFLIHAADDKTVKVTNSINFFMNLQKNHVPSEIHIYQNGGHGFGLNNPSTKDKWINSAIHWMINNKFIKGNVE